MARKVNPAPPPLRAERAADALAAAHRPPRIDPHTANATVLRAVAAWPGVTLHRHVMGGVEFRYGNHNLGHLHEPPGRIATADLHFAKPRRDELVASGRARRHVTDRHDLSGWLTVPMPTSDAVDFAIELFREAYMNASS